jgi:hypothetical protein
MIRLGLSLAALFASATFSLSQELPPLSLSKIIVAGQRTVIHQSFNLNPDCTATGPITVKVLKKPTNGKLEHPAEQGFPGYKSDNVRSKCNERLSDGTKFYYESNAGFVGTDQVEFQTFSAVGTSIVVRIRLTVK